MHITPLEANLLLFCLDDFLSVDSEGKLRYTFEGYTLEDVQSLRDRLFAHHEHPEEK